MKSGKELILWERLRQIDEEGWSYEHDEQHTEGELSRAAYCYWLEPDSPERKIFGDKYAPAAWPFDEEWWKPSPDDRVRELVKAGALVSAEMDRLKQFLSDITRKIDELQKSK